ncbi:hypothetical protein ACFXJ8_23425 [Nonomuraea sp. NPDC059194]|uniref:hypothetical protein n=1 Tax=Nonomuraea sp. NPDC059194 TaxID=3346764 RepID=UPI00368176FE
MTTTDTPPSVTQRPPATSVSGWLLRATVTAHTIAAFGQPAFAGVYLSGNIHGLSWHARTADVVSYLSVLQVVVAIVVSSRTRRRWPAVTSVLILAAEFGQYAVGMSGTLWVHIPLGVTIIAVLAVLFVVVWARPLPYGVARGRIKRASVQNRAGADV